MLPVDIGWRNDDYFRFFTHFLYEANRPVHYLLHGDAEPNSSEEANPPSLQLREQLGFNFFQELCCV